MDDLGFIVKVALGNQRLEYRPPVSIKLDGMFKNWNAMPDLHNLVIPVCDAVESALGINDQQYKVETGLPQLGPPRLIIAIKGEYIAR